MATSPSTQRAQSTPSPQAKFLALLRRDILKLDLADLDFGIYRILNYRRTHVLAFLADTLPSRINAWTHALAQASGGELASTEADNCYYHLHTFFARYWDDGDFIPRARRGGSAAYAVPYNGQDTHFHWATKGSHYVKSGELFARYAYKDGAQDIRFTLAQAELEKDNAKGSAKHFFPLRFAVVDGGFDLQWQWRAATDQEIKRYKNKSASRPKDEGQDDIAPDTDGDDTATEGATLQERVLNDWLTGNAYAQAKRPAGLNPVALASHARRFVRKNTSDFFVHPQLGEFLRGELDVYLKHEFVQVWDAPDAELPRIRAKFNLVRQIALDLIAFLNQIETFQATLFEKRKFVLQADYLVQCSWLAREAGAEGKKLLAEATASAGQAAEWAEWVGQKPSAKTTRKSKTPGGKKLLASYPHLPLHTKHFSADFKARVLACFDDIEAALGGELLHSDNYAALRTLDPAYRERVKCIYIDPPYNTGKDGFLYKDGYTHSTWQTMLDSRIRTSHGLLGQTGVFLASIDETERVGLTFICDLHFGIEGRVGNLVWKGATDNNPTRIAVEHEYVVCYSKSRPDKDDQWSIENSATKDLMLATYASICGQTNIAEKRVTLFEAFTDANREQLGDLYRYRRLDAHGPYAARRNMENPGKPGYKHDVFHPTTKRACAKPYWGWRFPEKTMQEFLETDRLIFGEDETKIPELKVYLKEVRFPLRSVIQMDARKGSNDLDRLFGSRDIFKNPKPTELLERVLPFTADKDAAILDFFAGSATTGHAVINLNREDGGARKFLLVEQGEYFDAVTLPRIAKVMTSPLWKDGIPKDGVQHDAGDDPEHWSRRTLPLVRVLRLERYEDSLNALELDVNQPLAQQNRAQAAIDLVAHDEQAQLLTYWLLDAVDAPRTGAAPSAVCLSTASLNTPFDYQLTLHEPTGERLANVDMLETARLLLGLVPKKQRDMVDAQGQRHQLMEAVLASDLARGTVAPKPVLLWLRTVDDERNDAAAHAEHDWLVSTVQTHFNRPIADYGTVFHNRSAFWPQGQQGVSLDALLAERMMERAR
ncbi:MAG: site-specific DNA-methyltransferase [Vitreoscilla sp.]|nr:site-specific DNA-methyltransferase [Polaromonas sp.]